MAEGSANAFDSTTARGLIYPPFAVPALGEVTEVAPGVLWLRFSMPMALNHINAFALADGEGWTLIDTGLAIPGTVQGWEAALAGPLEGRPVKRVICTHMHPDHIGLAGWLCETYAAPLLMSRLEYVTARMLFTDTGQAAPAEGEAFYRRAGWDEAQISHWRGSYGSFSKAVRPLPASYQRLSQDDVVRIGNDDWQVVIGRGHSPEHVCLWRKSDGVFLAGDQILPRISSNISVGVTEPDADPLGDWLTSLASLRDSLPSDLLVLPSHGEPFYGVTTRLEALVRGHEVALKRLERTLKQPCRAVDVFPALFARAIGNEVLGMATGEALAHLNYLDRRGRVGRRLDAEGVEWWTSLEGGQ